MGDRIEFPVLHNNATVVMLSNWECCSSKSIEKRESLKNKHRENFVVVLFDWENFVILNRLKKKTSGNCLRVAHASGDRCS